jgi:hypothetical protein
MLAVVAIVAVKKVCLFFQVMVPVRIHGCEMSATPSFRRGWDFVKT